MKVLKILVIVLAALVLGGTLLYKVLQDKGMTGVLNPGKIGDLKPSILSKAKNETNFPLTIPDGHSISVFAKGFENPRDLELGPNDTVLVSDTGAGKVYELPGKKEVVGGLNRPHGIAYAEGKLYVAETNQVSVFDYTNGKAVNKKKLADLPAGGNHFTRSLLLDKEKNRLFVSTGSSCNVCVEKDERRASIWVLDLGSQNSSFRRFASGLRNSVFMTLNPVTKEVWATDMGRDLLGDDIPPEEVNIVKEGKHYGWPYCWGNQVTDTETNPGNTKFDCKNSEKPHLTFQAHSAPLGLVFLGNDLLVAYHGSWNRNVPTGYKVVKFPLDSSGKPTGEPQDFISGWLRGEEALGRPVDILVKEKTEIYISDDKAGVVYLLQSQN